MHTDDTNQRSADETARSRSDETDGSPRDDVSRSDSTKRPDGNTERVRTDGGANAEGTNAEPITAERPDSPIQTTGTDHVTIWGSNATDTIEFYRDLLGMPLVMRQPNLDDPDQTHLFFDTGDGRILTVFVSDDRRSASGQRVSTGAVHHLCFSVAPERFEETADALTADGRGYNLFDRGIFLSLYTRDNNGLVIELTTDKYPIPDDRRGEVLALAHEKRVADGAEYAKDEHLEAALTELGLDATPNDLPDAASGTGGL